MIVIDNEKEFQDLVSVAVENALKKYEKENDTITNWKDLSDFLGICERQIRRKMSQGFYGNSILCSGKTLLASKKRIIEVLSLNK